MVWPPTKRQVFSIGAICIAMVLLILLGVWLWGVLANYIQPDTPTEKKDLVNVFVLIAAGVVGALTAIAAVGNLIISGRNLRQQRDLDEQHAQADAQQKYFELMGKLLTEEDLKKSKPDDVALLARVQTLTVLKRLNLEVAHEKLPKGAYLGQGWVLPKRPKVIKAKALSSGKREVISFLYEMGLIERDRTIVNLADADLTRAELMYGKLDSSNLSGTQLGFSYLGRASLNHAILSGARLWGAYLTGTELNDADLSGAELIDADLSGAKLKNANLSRAKFRGHLPGFADAILDGANLAGADLSDADITDEQLAECQHLAGATMPDRQILKGDTVPDGPTFEEWLKGKERNGKDADYPDTS